jgi:acyl-CoA thioester hydrolase
LSNSGLITAKSLPDIHKATVLPEWIDYNGHMNVAYYVLAFDHATDGLLDNMGLGQHHVKKHNSSFFVTEAHVNYLAEVVKGAPLRFTIQMLDHDDKRLHFFARMYHRDEGFLAATCEWLGVHIDLDKRRSSIMPTDAMARLADMKAHHSGIPWPEQAGRKMEIRRK